MLREVAQVGSDKITAYTEGNVAAGDGLGLNGNPYEPMDQCQHYLAWIRGWTDYFIGEYVE